MSVPTARTGATGAPRPGFRRVVEERSSTFRYTVFGSPREVRDDDVGPPVPSGRRSRCPFRARLRDRAPAHLGGDVLERAVAGCDKDVRRAGRSRRRGRADRRRRSRRGRPRGRAPGVEDVGVPRALRTGRRRPARSASPPGPRSPRAGGARTRRTTSPSRNPCRGSHDVEVHASVPVDVSAARLPVTRCGRPRTRATSRNVPFEVLPQLGASDTVDEVEAAFAVDVHRYAPSSSRRTG